jgi:hypothetical protein
MTPFGETDWAYNSGNVSLGRIARNQGLPHLPQDVYIAAAVHEDRSRDRLKQVPQHLGSCGERLPESGRNEEVQGVALVHPGALPLPAATGIMTSVALARGSRRACAPAPPPLLTSVAFPCPAENDVPLIAHL